MADKTQELLLRTLFVSVRSPDRVYYEGEALAVSCKNLKGPFDILPQHESFISTIQEKVVIYKSDHTKQEIPIERGIIKVFENAVYIFVGITIT